MLLAIGKPSSHIRLPHKRVNSNTFGMFVLRRRSAVVYRKYDITRKSVQSLQGLNAEKIR